MSLLSAQISLPTKPKQLDILIFTKHLATMVKSGIPIQEALSTYIDDMPNNVFKHMLRQILAKVTNGSSLSQAMTPYTNVFGALYINLIKISEESGTLDENLDFIVKQLTKNYSLKKKIQGAMLYPILILVSALGMGGFIAFYILPQLTEFFAAFNMQLPFTTRVLLLLADAFKYHGVLIGVTVIGSTIGFNILIRTRVVKPMWHTFLLRLPMIGVFIRNAELAQLSRNLGILLKSGVPIAQSMAISSDTVGNLVFKKHLKQVSQSLTKGKSIAETLKQQKYKEFPSLVIRMIAVGEKTGNLDESLLYLGDHYEEEVDNTSKNISTMIEPILLVCIGLLVGFVALAIITPIYQFTGSIGR